MWLIVCFSNFEGFGGRGATCETRADEQLAWLIKESNYRRREME